MSVVPDELPEGWCISTIEELCELNPKHDSSLKANLPVSFVPMAAVSEVEGQITTAEVRPLGEVKKGYTHFADGDVILAKITPCMENGKAASVRRMVNGLACGTTEFFVFRPRGAIYQDYLFKFIRQESFRRAARATMQSGVGQARVPKEFVLEAEIPLAPLPEQHRIVAKIEALQARSRKAREALEAIPSLLEQFRQSVLAAAFRGDLTADWREQHPDVEPASVLLERIRTERRRKWEQAELAKLKAKGKKPKDDSWKEKYVELEPVENTDVPELPDGWCWASLGEIVSGLQQGWSPKCENDATDNPTSWAVIKTTAVQAMAFLPHENKKLPKSLEPVVELEIQKHDLLITRAGPRVRAGVMCLVKEVRKRLILCDKAYRFRAENGVVPEYLEITLNSPQCVSALDALKTGISDSGVNLTQDRFLELQVPLPPSTEQLAIAERARRYWNDSVSIQNNASELANELNTLDQSILAKAFRGELVPQDPNDEPASALLERIRSQLSEEESVTIGTAIPRRRANSGRKI